MSAAPRPLLLRPDNFTPPSRTPWGGTRIARHYKATLGLDPALTIGEAWEVSVEPSFPSRAAEDGRPLSEHIAADPAAWLGRDGLEAGGGQLTLLVKLLDAGEDLSVQVHPDPDDPRLGPGESGKPEAWVILEAAEGAGLYLGWRAGVDRAAVEACLAAGKALAPLLNFVPVRAGEVFEVPAGTPHAIGAGVTLVEPQRVSPGRRALTYRYWDWDRRYDDAGRPDPLGLPRPLQVTAALEATAWGAPSGPEAVERCRRRPSTLAQGNGWRLQGLLRTPWFGADRLEAAGAAQVELQPGPFRALTCLAGELRLHLCGAEAGAGLAVAAGQSAALPAGAYRLEVGVGGLDAIIAWP